MKSETGDDAVLDIAGLARIWLQMLMMSPFDENAHQFAFVFLNTFAHAIQQRLDEFYSIYIAILEQMGRLPSSQRVRHKMAICVLSVGSLCCIAVHNRPKIKVIALSRCLRCRSCAHW